MFLENSAKKIVESSVAFENLTIVVPSQRMITYLQKALFIEKGKAFISPKIITIDRWILDCVKIPVLEKALLLIELYRVFEADPVESQRGDFDQFLNWAEMLLSDFEEIDRYLVEPKELFKNLRDVREIEMWSFDHQKELSKGQLEFMAFWDKLGPYYLALKKRLKGQNKTTKGAAYRYLSENISACFTENKNAHFFFIGFNALSLAEISIMKQLSKMGRAEILIDSDVAYLNEDIHEAGAFHRDLLKHLQVKKIPFIGDKLNTKSMSISLIPCSQKTAQVSAVGSQLAKMTPQELNETLVLLADESLLSPLLRYLPKSIGSANISLGLPLKSTNIRSWIDLLFRIQENYKKRSVVYYRELFEFFHHSFLHAITNPKERELLFKKEQDILQKNRLYLSVKSLNLDSKLNELADLFFQPWNENFNVGLNQIKKMCLFLDDHFPKEAEVERATVRSFFKSLDGFQKIVDADLPPMQLKTFKRLFDQHWGKATVSYFGNALGGLQIMGLLETRGLDFKNVLVLGLNEGAMPPTNPIQSFVPMDLRAFFKLPTMREKQGLFAHHFYRLMHEANQLFITYHDSENDKMMQEESRYIQQLKLELVNQNPKIEIEITPFSYGEADEINEKKYQKTEAVISRLDEIMGKQISYSAIQTFAQCPLDFFYKRVLGFGEEDSMEENLESNTMGTIMHEVIEDLYRPFLIEDKSFDPKKYPGRQVTQEHVEEMIKKMPMLVDKSFQKHFTDDKEVLQNGINYIHFEMVKEALKNVLKQEKNTLESGALLFILGLEKSLSLEYEATISGIKRKINLVAKIDRIDYFNGEIRVFDYKSKSFKENSVDIKKPRTEAEHWISKELGGDAKFAFQLLWYNYMLELVEGIVPSQLGILSFKSVQHNPILLKKAEDYAKGNVFNEIDKKQLFESVLNKILSEIYDQNQSFVHKQKGTISFCKYCN